MRETLGLRVTITGSDVLGLGAAIDFMKEQGIESIARHEEELLHYAMKQLKEVPGMRFFGTAPHKAGVVSFLLGNAHPDLKAAARYIAPSNVEHGVLKVVDRLVA